MTEADPALAAATAVATALLGSPLDEIARVPGAGRNSRIYRVRRGGESFVLKHYPSRGQDARDRLRVELDALDLMTRHGITVVPRTLASDAERGYALLEWIEGDNVGAASDKDIDAAARFLAAIHSLRGLQAAQAQPLAAEACLSGAEIVAQIDRRIARLSAVGANEPALAALIANEVGPLLAATAAWAEAEYDARGFGFATPVPETARTLCPSDFGFHNALRTPSGRLVFIDFDYFGWDDPVKLTSDFLLHPGMRLTGALKRRFVTAVRAVYGTDPTFGDRLGLLFPLFALRWCTILLNEFLPERWAHRLHAGAQRDDWASVKQRQLDRAGEWVQGLRANWGWFPYGE
jgi:hypothetical protein